MHESTGSFLLWYTHNHNIYTDFIDRELVKLPAWNCSNPEKVTTDKKDLSCRCYYCQGYDNDSSPFLFITQDKHLHGYFLFSKSTSMFWWLAREFWSSNSEFPVFSCCSFLNIQHKFPFHTQCIPVASCVGKYTVVVFNMPSNRRYVQYSFHKTKVWWPDVRVWDTPYLTHLLKI